MLDRQETTVSMRCPLCSSDRTVSNFEKSGQQYRRCADCTLMFARGGTNANFRESISDFEPAYLQYLNDGPIDTSNLDDVIAWIESHVSLASPALRLLDVGAGSGKLVRRLRHIRPCVVSGIEPSAALFKNYRLGNLAIEPIALPQLASRDTAPYDVLTVLDVVEHVPDAAEFLHALARVTKPGGFVFLSTPDTGGFLARVLGRFWHHCNPYHFSLYGVKAMAEAARLHGFRMVAAEHRSKRMSLDYFWNYARDFLFAAGRRDQSYRPSRFSIPVNLGDTLYVVWQRLPS